ncbi:MAG TPA: hypothetical protein VI729_06045 [Anaerolineales bacterium]|nr:hypothetical protein [Anaerolineales bacterium]
MLHDYTTLVRARMQEIDREIMARQLRAGLQKRGPGWITRSLVQLSGKLGTVLVKVGRRLEGDAYRITGQSDGLQTGGRPGLNLVSERGVRSG